MSLIISMKDCDTMSVNPSLSVSNPLQQTLQQLQRINECKTTNEFLSYLKIKEKIE